MAALDYVFDNPIPFAVVMATLVVADLAFVAWCIRIAK